jgi:membrane associated rhomboid family serine protease
MREIPVVTKNLIAINVLMYLAMLAFERSGIFLDNLLGLHIFLAPDFSPYQLVTYMFMHENFPHILFNMYAVWVFGSILERVWGSSRFLFFYFATGIGAGLMQELVQYIYFSTTLAQYTQVNIGGGEIITMAEYLNSWTTVGASGAVYGILLAFAMTFPNEQLFMIPFPFPIKAKYFVMIFGALQLVTGLSNNAGDNVAHFAHLGGMIFGLILILYWRKKGKIDGPYNF